jgi:hypothetical protein|tara:strand:- start:19 stop:495 length:477 start_codon:yes stop_codon:yes gene_type:complete
LIEVNVTNDMFVKAREKAIEVGRLNNSILNGGGNLAGFIGEQIVLQVLGGDWLNTYEYDLIIDGHKVDVKTKQTSVVPLPHYECSITEYNAKQDCDYYAFTRVKKDFSVGWYLGAMKKADYFYEAKYLKKGEVDPSNNYTVRATCYNLAIDKLKERLE